MQMNMIRCGQSLIARIDEMVDFFRSKDEMTVADMHSLVYGIWCGFLQLLLWQQTKQLFGEYTISIIALTLCSNYFNLFLKVSKTIPKSFYSSVLLLVFNKLHEKMLFIKFILHTRRPKFFFKRKDSHKRGINLKFNFKLVSSTNTSSFF